MAFTPPIESRETDELIVMSKGSTDDYQAEAIELARKELMARNISQVEIDKRYAELYTDYELYAEQAKAEMAAEDYSVFEKIWIVLFWPREILWGWHLKRDGFTTKAKHRIQLILVGVALYALIIKLS